MARRYPLAIGELTHVAALSLWSWILVAALAGLVLYAAFVLWLLLAGRREDARALAGFVPDCIALFRRLLVDRRLTRRSRLLIVGLIGYLALPIDLVPDFIPVAGQLDDAIVLALVLRSVLRGGGPELVRKHWRGPERSLAVVLRLGAL